MINATRMEPTAIKGLTATDLILNSRAAATLKIINARADMVHTPNIARLRVPANPLQK
jgi:hypothetical protein